MLHNEENLPWSYYVGVCGNGMSGKAAFDVWQEYSSTKKVRLSIRFMRSSTDLFPLSFPLCSAPLRSPHPYTQLPIALPRSGRDGIRHGGRSPVGSFVIQLAKLDGCKVIASAGSKEG